MAQDLDELKNILYHWKTNNKIAVIIDNGLRQKFFLEHSPNHFTNKGIPLVSNVDGRFYPLRCDYLKGGLWSVSLNMEETK